MVDIFTFNTLFHLEFIFFGDTLGKCNDSMLCVCVFKERDSTSRGGAKGEGERESQAGSTPSSEPNDVGLDLITVIL